MLNKFDTFIADKNLQELILNICSILTGVENGGVHELLYNSVMKSDIDLSTKDLFGNMVLSGGSTMFPGKVYYHITNLSLSSVLL